MSQAEYFEAFKKLLAENKAALQNVEPNLWDKLHRAGSQEAREIRRTVETVLNDPESALARDLNSYAKQLAAMRKHININQEQSTAAKELIQEASKRIEEQYALFRDQLSAMKQIAEEHIGAARADELKQLFSEHKDVIRTELVSRMQPLFELKRAYEEQLSVMIQEKEQMKEEQDERKKEYESLNKHIFDSNQLLGTIATNTNSSQQQAIYIKELANSSDILRSEQRKLSALLFESFDFPRNESANGALPSILAYIEKVDASVGTIQLTQEGLAGEVARTRGVIDEVKEYMLKHASDDVNMNHSDQLQVAAKLDQLTRQLSFLSEQLHEQITANSANALNAHNIKAAYEEVINLANTVIQASASASASAQQTVRDLNTIGEGAQQIYQGHVALHSQQQQLANQVQSAYQTIDIKEQQLNQTSQQLQQLATAQNEIAAKQESIAAKQDTALRSILNTGKILSTITTYVIPKFNADIRSFSEKMKLAERSMLEKKETQPKRKFDQPIAQRNIPDFYKKVDDTDSESSSDEDNEAQPMQRSVVGKGRQSTKYMQPVEHVTLEDFTPTHTGVQLAVKAQLRMKTGTVLFNTMEEFLARSPFCEDELIIVHSDDQYTHARVPDFAYVPTLGMCIAGGKGKVLTLVAALPSMLFFVEEERQRGQVYTRCYGLLQLTLLGFTQTVILMARANSDTLRFKPIEAIHASNGQPLYSLSTSRGPTVSDGGIRITIRDIPYLIQIIDYAHGRSRFPDFIQRDFLVACKQISRYNWKASESE